MNPGDGKVKNVSRFNQVNLVHIGELQASRSCNTHTGVEGGVGGDINP